MKKQAGWIVGAAVLASIVGAGFAEAADSSFTPGPLAVRRLSPQQYRQIVADLFGADIKIGGRFEPDIRDNGLLAVGAGRVSVTATGIEQYDGMARTIAAQVVDREYRDLLVPCKPAAENAPDDACARQFFTRTGPLLYRRPLTEQEITLRVSDANLATKSLKNFYTGLELSLAGMMASPQFLFRNETAEPDPDHAGQFRLDAYSKASQLSFLLWNAGPDPELLDAAAKGDLNSRKGLARQVDRMLASPRLEDGIRAFFADMFAFSEFDTLAKDAAIYPKFSPQVAQDAQEQTMRTIVDLLVLRNGDYRDLFTARRTFLTPGLAALYGVPFVRTAPNGAPDDWQAFEYPQGDARAGLLAQASFVALHAHPGRSSPTLRGKALREIMLCQKVPDPPGNVNFAIVQDTSNPQFKTSRDRVTAHRSDAVCAGCHKLIDPMGLALETFDGGGSYRTTENNVKIDASGELDGVKFDDALGLGRAMHDNPAVTSCLVNRLYTYALGRVTTKGEADFVKSLNADFAAGGYQLPGLLKKIATSDEFYRVSAPQVGALDGGRTHLTSTQSLDGRSEQ